MIEALAFQLIEAVATSAGLIDEHPDLAKTLLRTVEGIVSGHDEKTFQKLEAVRAMVSGVAAARANAVQEAMRRIKTPELQPKPR
jgi:hypothetical protein